MDQLSLAYLQRQGWVEELSLPLGLAETSAWLVRLDPLGEIASDLAPLLSPDERDRAARFIVPRLPERFVASHAALRIILGQRLNLNPSQLAFRPEEHGKPVLVEHAPRCHFNLSHSGTLALVAVGHRPLGVDIEQIQEHRDLAGIAQRFFAPAECQLLAQTPTHDLSRVFTRLWTRKEAVLKASGKGIASGLQAIDLSPALAERGPSGPLLIQHAGVNWEVYDLTAPAGYTAALAWVAPANPSL